jgi:hypothetical protein
MRVRRLALLSCLPAILLALAPAQAAMAEAGDGGASASKKRNCKKRNRKCQRKPKPKPQVPQIRSGKYGTEVDLYLEVDTKARTAGFHFRRPCDTSTGSTGATSGPTVVTAGLPSTKVGSSLTMSGTYTGRTENGLGIATTAWDMSGTFTKTGGFRGKVHYVVDIPPPTPQFLPFHCENTSLEFELR